MQDLIVALYDDHATAVSVRTQLVRDGFPTDRVTLTSAHEHGQADMGPKSAFSQNVRDYFHTLKPTGHPDGHLDEFLEAVLKGGATVTVHPRGEEEIRRASAIIERHQPYKVHRYLPQDAGHVRDRKMERAAAPKRQ